MKYVNAITTVICISIFYVILDIDFHTVAVVLEGSRCSCIFKCENIKIILIILPPHILPRDFLGNLALGIW